MVAINPRVRLVDPALGHKLLDVFSGMEHALKTVGLSREPGGYVEADWDAFARLIAAEFQKLQEQPLLDAVSFLVTAPARREVTTAAGSGWKSLSRSQGLSDMEWLLRIVRQVRNNYFHGGKHSSKAPVEPGRDQRLVESALTVLMACIPLHAEVKVAYDAVAL
jgi:hypothetical protein